MSKVLTGAVIAAVAMLGVGIAGASDGLPSQTPGMNFNQSVPPIVVTPPTPPTPVPVTFAPAPVTRRNTITTSTTTEPPTTTRTVAPLPVCPADGTVFLYGSCTLPPGVAAPRGVVKDTVERDGRAHIVSSPCGLAIVPRDFEAAPMNDPVCDPPLG
jgi:hypothetical protein